MPTSSFSYLSTAKVAHHGKFSFFYEIYNVNCHITNFLSSSSFCFPVVSVVEYVTTLLSFFSTPSLNISMVAVSMLAAKTVQFNPNRFAVERVRAVALSIRYWCAVINRTLSWAGSTWRVELLLLVCCRANFRCSSICCSSFETVQKSDSESSSWYRDMWRLSRSQDRRLHSKRKGNRYAAYFHHPTLVRAH